MSGKGYRAAGFMDGFMNGFDFVDRLQRAEEEREYRRSREGGLYPDHVPDLRKVRAPRYRDQAPGLGPTLERSIDQMEGMPPYIRNDRLLDRLRGAYGLLGGKAPPPETDRLDYGYDGWEDDR